MMEKDIDPKEKKNEMVINAAKVKSSTLYFGIIVLSKPIITKNEVVNYETCLKIKDSRYLKNWMDFDYMYIFDMNSLKQKRNAVDEILPYKRLIDFCDWSAVKFIQGNLMGFYLENSKEQMIFVF